MWRLKLASSPDTCEHDDIQGMIWHGADLLCCCNWCCYKQVEGIARVDANDLDPTALTAMSRNVEFNGPTAQAKVHPQQGDARVAMLQNAEVSASTR